MPLDIIKVWLKEHLELTIEISYADGVGESDCAYIGLGFKGDKEPFSKVHFYTSNPS